MKKLSISAAFGILMIGAPTGAHHADHLGIPYDSRGECEATMAQLRNGDREFLMNLAPDIFDTAGDVNAFLSRAFTCDLGDAGAWYITDHRLEVLDSDWFQRRSR